MLGLVTKIHRSRRCKGFLGLTGRVELGGLGPASFATGGGASCSLATGGGTSCSASLLWLATGSDIVGADDSDAIMVEDLVAGLVAGLSIIVGV